MEGQFEETVQGASSRIDGGDSRWCQYHMLLSDMGANIFQEGRFTRTCFPRQENRLAGVLNQVQCILEFGVMGIYLHVFFRVLRFALADRACFQAQI